jgi:transcriptional regulator with XRE-family HTH domain
MLLRMDAQTEKAMQRLGKNIKLQRVEREITQEGLALSAGLARSHVSQIESGQLSVSVPTLLKIARALDVSPARLLADVE